MSAHLVSVSDSMLGRRFILNGSAVMGRGVECDVSLVDAGVSRHHARLHENAGGWIIEDLSSRNGVWVNGSRIAAPVTLNSNDCVSVGPFLLLFEPDFSVLASDFGRGAAIVAADSKTLTSHRPERIAYGSEGGDGDLDNALLTALAQAVAKTDSDRFWDCVFAPIIERFAPDVCGVLTLDANAAADASLESVFVSPADAQLVIPSGILDTCRHATGAAGGGADALVVAGGVTSPLASLRGDASTSAATLTIPVIHEGAPVALVQLARYRTGGWREEETQPLLHSAAFFHTALATAAQLERARKQGAAAAEDGEHGQDPESAILGDSRAITRAPTA